MVFSVPIPSDIVHDVLDYLRDDVNTLKACAIVSQSFLPLSRKHLFFAIHIDHFHLSRRLYDLLRQKPEIAEYIRELYFDDIVGRGMQAWQCLVTDQATCRMLPTLHCLRRLSLSPAVIIDWNSLPNDLISALTHQFRSPCLDFVTIGRFRGVPMSILSLLVREVKNLHLQWASLEDDLHEHPLVDAEHAPKLEVLELGLLPGSRSRPPPELFHSARKLHAIFLLSSTISTLSAAQSVIRSCGSSIKSIGWMYSENNMEGTLPHSLVL